MRVLMEGGLTYVEGLELIVECFRGFWEGDGGVVCFVNFI